MKKITMSIIIMVVIVMTTVISVNAFQNDLYINQDTKQVCSFLYSRISQYDKNILINSVAQKVILHLVEENMNWFNNCIAKHGKDKFIKTALPIFKCTEKILRENYPGWFLVYVHNNGVIDPWDYMDTSDTNKIRKGFKKLIKKL